MNKHITKLAKNEDGISAVEYLIALAVVALLIIGGFSALGGAIDDKANEGADAVETRIDFGG